MKVIGADEVVIQHRGFVYDSEMKGLVEREIHHSFFNYDPPLALCHLLLLLILRGRVRACM